MGYGGEHPFYFLQFVFWVYENQKYIPLFCLGYLWYTHIFIKWCFKALEWILRGFIYLLDRFIIYRLPSTLKWILEDIYIFIKKRFDIKTEKE